MIVTWRIGIRVALIMFLAVILQVSFFSYLTILGATPDFVGVVVVALGLLGGGVIGAVCGFATGLLVDSVLLQTLGVSSLVLLTMGYLAGRFREGFELSGVLVPAALAGVLTLAGASIFAAIQLMLGVDTPVSLLVIREILVKGLLAFLLAWPAYPLMRRALRPALVDDLPARRRLMVPAGLRRGRRLRRRRGERLTGTVGARRVRGGVV